MIDRSFVVGAPHETLTHQATPTLRQTLQEIGYETA